MPLSPRVPQKSPSRACTLLLDAEVKSPGGSNEQKVLLPWVKGRCTGSLQAPAKSLFFVCINQLGRFGRLQPAENPVSGVSGSRTRSRVDTTRVLSRRKHDCGFQMCSPFNLLCRSVTQREANRRVEGVACNRWQVTARIQHLEISWIIKNLLQSSGNTRV